MVLEVQLTIHLNYAVVIFVRFPVFFSHYRLNHVLANHILVLEVEVYRVD